MSRMLFNPSQIILIALAGWMNREQSVVIEVSTRRVEIAGIAPDPNGLWMNQVARNLTDFF